MTYEEAIEYINEIGKKGSVLGLGPITELLARLDDPQEKLSIIHVAGTNGKGSICTFLEMLYRADGRKVGRYISPTIHDYLERFQINGKYMDETSYTEILTEVKDAVSTMEKEGLDLPTAFEVETAVAFMYFARENVDVVILEVGMGGRFDATNVIKHPLCTVFANIGMDHMQFLGDTIEKIAFEKAGIIKCGSPAVCYPMDERAIDVIKKEYFDVNEVNITCDEEGRQNEISCDKSADKTANKPGLNVRQIVVADTKELNIISQTLKGSTFIYKGNEYTISLAGTYQIYNAITAIETKLLLDGHIDKEALKNARWEGRFEKICDKPLFIKDGAHNVQGVTALFNSLQKHFTKSTFIFIIGVLGDKEYEKMMEILCPLAKCCYLIKPENPRGLETEVLSDVVGRYCDDVTCCASVSEAVEMAVSRWKEMTGALGQNNYNNECTDGTRHDKEKCDNEDVVIVAWGSLSYIGEVKITG